MEQCASVAGQRPAIATEGRWGIAVKSMPAALACQGTGGRQEQLCPATIGSLAANGLEALEQSYFI